MAFFAVPETEGVLGDAGERFVDFAFAAVPPAVFGGRRDAGVVRLLFTVLVAGPPGAVLLLQDDEVRKLRFADLRRGRPCRRGRGDGGAPGKLCGTRNGDCRHNNQKQYQCRTEPCCKGMVYVFSCHKGFSRSVFSSNIIMKQNGARVKWVKLTEKSQTSVTEDTIC